MDDCVAQTPPQADPTNNAAPFFSLRRNTMLPVCFAIAVAAPAEAQHRDPSSDDVPNIMVMDRRLEVRGPRIGSKISLPEHDLPLSVESVDAETIGRTGYNELATLLDVTTSAITNPGEGGLFNEVLLRGFADTPIYRNGINDSLGQPPVRNLANVERIEILKGPYGALYGPGEPGGAVNFVTKTPQYERSSAVSVAFASRSAFDVAIDATGPLTTSDAAYRFIAMREQGDTFRDFVKRDRLFVNPMLSYQASESVRLNASFEFTRDERLIDTGVITVDGVVPIPLDRFLGEPSTRPAQIESYTFQLSSAFEISPDWLFDLSLNGQKTSFNGDTLEPEGIRIDSGRTLLDRALTRQREVTQSMIAQAELSGKTTLWSIPNHMLIGTSVTAFNENVKFLSSDTDDDPLSIDILRPAYAHRNPSLAPERDSAEQTRQVSLYAQDILELGPRWRVLFGLRFDHIDQSGSDRVATSRFDGTSDEISPRIGVVYKPVPAWSWFASYSESIDPNEGLRPDGTGLVPTQSEAVEVGVKWLSPSYPLSIDASVFGIRQTNVTADAPGNPGFEIQTSAQESIGVDFEMRAAPSDWLDILAHYSYVDAQIVDDPILNDGTTPLNVAKHQAGITMLFQRSMRQKDDFSVALSVYYLGKRQGSLEPNELDLTLAGYMRSDVVVSYKFSRHLKLQLSFDNLTDTDYVRGSQSDALHLSPGPPLTVRGQLSFEF